MAPTLRVGSVVRAPWRDAGDDIDMTGSVTSLRRLGSTKTPHVVITWHDNGSVTPAGDESTIPVRTFDEDSSLVVSY